MLELELVGVSLSAIMPSTSAELEYVTYMSAVEELWNGCLSISATPESSSTQLPSKVAPRYCSLPTSELIWVQAGGSPASVPATKHAIPMAQTNNEASFFGTAAARLMCAADRQRISNASAASQSLTRAARAASRTED